jgi:hypothetical protein
MALALHDESLIEIRPVTLDSEGDVVTTGVPQLVSLADLKAWILADVETGGD